MIPYLHITGIQNKHRNSRYTQSFSKYKKFTKKAFIIQITVKILKNAKAMSRIQKINK